MAPKKPPRPKLSKFVCSLVTHMISCLIRKFISAIAAILKAFSPTCNLGRQWRLFGLEISSTARLILVILVHATILESSPSMHSDRRAFAITFDECAASLTRLNHTAISKTLAHPRWLHIPKAGTSFAANLFAYTCRNDATLKSEAKILRVKVIINLTCSVN